MAQLERELLRERVRAGMAMRKLAAERIGQKWKCGRPSKVTKELEREIAALRCGGKSIREIAKILGIGKTTIQRVAADLKR